MNISNKLNSYPVLSICVPTFNRVAQLDRLLASIVKQKQSSLIEVCISDNCSTDETEDIVKKYKASLHINYRKNLSNIGFARNYLNVIGLAVGQFLWVVGDDDIIIDGALDYLISKITNNHHVSLFHVPAYFHGRESYFSRWPRETPLSGSRYRRLLFFDALYSPGFIGATIYKRSDVVMVIPDTIKSTSWPHLYILLSVANSVNYVTITRPLIMQVGDALYWKPSNWIIIQFGKVLILNELVASGGIARIDAHFMVCRILLGLRAFLNVLQVHVCDSSGYPKYRLLLIAYLVNQSNNFRLIISAKLLLDNLSSVIPWRWTYSKAKFILPSWFKRRFDFDGLDPSHEGSERNT